ncbi:MAG: VOC family protein [Anaerolineae bacterium]
MGLYPFRGVSGQEIAAWYGETFGLKVTEGSSSLFVEGTGRGRLEIMKQGETDRCHIAVQVADFEAAVAAMQAKGIELEEPVIRPGSKLVYLKQTDPAGNRVHLFWRK